jgi:putative transposase
MLALAHTCEGPGSVALRRGRRSLAGQVYLITTTTVARKPWFTDFDVATRAVQAIVSPAHWGSSSLLCWTLMPDHWHAIVELGPGEQLPDLVRRVKGASALEINRYRCAVGSVWAGGYHDHALRYEEDLVGVARYVVANPVRAGLVACVGDYPFWDAVWLREHRG